VTPDDPLDDPLDEPVPPGPAFGLLAAIDAMDKDDKPADTRDG